MRIYKIMNERKVLSVGRGMTVARIMDASEHLKKKKEKKGAVVQTSGATGDEVLAIFD